MSSSQLPGVGTGDVIRLDADERLASQAYTLRHERGRVLASRQDARVSAEDDGLSAYRRLRAHPDQPAGSARLHPSGFTKPKGLGFVEDVARRDSLRVGLHPTERLDPGARHAPTGEPVTSLSGAADSLSRNSEGRRERFPHRWPERGATVPSSSQDMTLSGTFPSGATWTTVLPSTRRRSDKVVSACRERVPTALSTRSDTSASRRGAGRASPSNSSTR